MNLEPLVRAAAQALERHRSAKEAVRREKAALAEYVEDHKAAIEVQKIVQALAVEEQSHAHQQITAAVTSSLQYVYHKPYKFQIVFERKRGKTQARMCYTLGGHEIDPVNEDGGGLLDVAALALRLSALSLGIPKRRKTMFMDEPLRNVNGDEYRERAAQLIEQLAKRFGFQFILSTGMEWLKIGKVVAV